VADNLLGCDFTAVAPNQRWVTDITAISTDEGTLYLSAIKDLFSRKVVGGAMDAHMETSLIVRALDMAIGNRQPDVGLLRCTTAIVAASAPAVITGSTWPTMA